MGCEQANYQARQGFDQKRDKKRLELLKKRGMPEMSYPTKEKSKLSYR